MYQGYRSFVDLLLCFISHALCTYTIITDTSISPFGCYIPSWKVSYELYVVLWLYCAGEELTNSAISKFSYLKFWLRLLQNKLSLDSSSHSHITDITTSLCGNNMMFGTATYRVFRHCHTNSTNTKPFTSCEKLSICPHVKIDYCLSTNHGRQGIIDMLFSTAHWQNSATLDSSNCFMVLYPSI